MKAVHIDGALVFIVGASGALLGCVSSDSAYHYLNPVAVFWIKTISTVLGAGCTALIGFRSKVFAIYSDSQNQPQKTN